MLLELTIRNFTLIDELHFQLGPGLNVLTGETGAGKSIIVDAVNLVLGGRASTEFIREPAEKALVEGVFVLPQVDKLYQLLETYGIEVDHDDPLVMTREMSRNGRSLCRVNGRVTTLGNYRRIGQFLVDLHGQHEHQTLLNPVAHLEQLDNFGGEALLVLRGEVASCYRKLHNVVIDLERLQRDEQEMARRQDLLTFQIEELDSAHLQPGEEEALQQEKTILQNAERLAHGVTAAYQMTYAGSPQQNAAYDLLGKVVAELKTLSLLDAALQPVTEILEASLYQTEEAAHVLRRYMEEAGPDPLRLEQIEVRLNLLRQLKRKYGASIPEILQFRQEAEAELELLVKRESTFTDLQEKRVQLEEEYRNLAKQLTERRKQTALILEEGINRELSFLGMNGAGFTVCFQSCPSPSALGVDEVEFLLSPNPGEPLKPLARIASGGELSRIMLALKTLLAKVDQVPTMIFDEIDTGIGGRALEAVAMRLGQIANSHQVLCVTHAAQIAGWADHHFYIEKQLEAGRTLTRISRLAEENRVWEIARMLSGNTESEVSRQHAIEMLKRAQGQKSLN